MFLKKLCLNQSERNGIRIKVKFMKEFLRALKLYIKVNFTPSLLAIPFFFMFLSLVLIIVSGIKSAENYTSTLRFVSQLHMGLFSVGFTSGVLASLKFFHSTKFAKLYFTKAKSFSMLFLCVIYDLVLFVAAALFIRVDLAFDMLIVNAVSSFILCMINTTLWLETKYSIYGLIPWIAFCFGGNSILENINYGQYGFGLPVYADVAIAVGIYLFVLLLTIAISTHWWNKSQRNIVGKASQMIKA